MLGGRDAVGTSREASGGSKKVMTFEAASEGKRNKFWKWHPGTGEKGIYMMIKGKGSENSVLGIGIKAGDSRAGDSKLHKGEWILFFGKEEVSGSCRTEKPALLSGGLGVTLEAVGRANDGR